MTYNIPALEKLHDSISRERHNQRFWGKLNNTSNRARIVDVFPTVSYGGRQFSVSCPTAACAAGWAVTNAGAQMLFNSADLQVYGTAEAVFCQKEDGTIEGIAEYAAEILGLDAYEANCLFAGFTSTPAVLIYIEQIIAAARHNMTWSEFNELSGRVQP